MDKGKPGDLSYLATCQYCGTQTRIAPRTVGGDEPVKCEMCGAPLEVEVPDPRTKRIRKKPKPVKCSQCGVTTDVSHIYYVEGLIYCEQCNELDYRERDRWEQRALVVAIIIGLVAFAFLIFVLATWPY
jgi:predicted nucleic acid-binding Zn ribbon protein